MNVRVEALLNSIHDDEAVFISSYPNIFYYSAFTSEDAFLLISHNESYIITDSRYTIQAKEQSGEFTLYDIKDGFEKLFSKIIFTRNSPDFSALSITATGAENEKI